MFRRTTNFAGAVAREVIGTAAAVTVIVPAFAPSALIMVLP